MSANITLSWLVDSPQRAKPEKSQRKHNVLVDLGGSPTNIERIAWTLGVHKAAGIHTFCWDLNGSPLAHTNLFFELRSPGQPIHPNHEHTSKEEKCPYDRARIPVTPPRSLENPPQTKKGHDTLNLTGVKREGQMPFKLLGAHEREEKHISLGIHCPLIGGG